MKRFVLQLLVPLMFCSTVLAFGYNHVGTKEFKASLESGKPMVILDIQIPADFAQHHFRGAVETNAFPVKSDAERGKLDKALPSIAATKNEVVIVCPRGGGGAKNAYDYLKSKGVDEKRLRILEGGMQGWPFPALALKSGAVSAAVK